jgi:hypothetical protein
MRLSQLILATIFVQPTIRHVGLATNTVYSVLPGPEEALPPIEQKFTIWRKHSSISNFLKIPLLFRNFLVFS